MAEYCDEVPQEVYDANKNKPNQLMPSCFGGLRIVTAEVEAMIDEAVNLDEELDDDITLGMLVRVINHMRLSGYCYY